MIETATSLEKISSDPGPRELSGSSVPVPWQIWVVVACLALDGLAGLLTFNGQPEDLLSLLTKGVFIVGMVRGWRWAFALFILFASLHVIYFVSTAPIGALLNLALIGFALSARRFYFGNAASAEA